MGDLAKAVAALEDKVKDVRMVRQIVERLDTEIATRMDEIETIGGALLDVHGDLDHQIAEYDYTAVEQSAASVRGLVDVEEVLPAIDTVLLLTALRDDEALPDLTLTLSSFQDDDDSWDHPRLSQQDLDRTFEAAMARADQGWEDGEWSDQAEQESRHAEYRAHAELEAIKDRAHRAGTHLMELVDHIGDTLWPELIEAVEDGNRDRAVHALAAACAAARETEPAYKLYEVNLSAQYEASPMSLGAMGESLSGLEAWVMSPKAE
ncbi:hypothetical protein [Streptomyces sp. NPDC047000]|uniref:hypothetical protein n=1 Tax=Streptomyces sp. NPDC047000 TaxID=3155474 RepID=UPI0033D0DC16